MSLKMWANETDHYVAESVQQVVEVWEKTTGMKWAEYADETLDEWAEVEQKEPLTLLCELQDYQESDYPAEAARVRVNVLMHITARVSAWCAHARKAQFLCSTEW